MVCRLGEGDWVEVIAETKELYPIVLVLRFAFRIGAMINVTEVKEPEPGKGA